MILLNKRVKAKSKWSGAYHLSFDAPIQLIRLHRQRRIQLYPYNSDIVALKFLEHSNPNALEITKRVVQSEIERMEVLDNLSTDDVHHGECVSDYLKRNAPLPKWAERMVTTRSGSASTWYCVFIPHFDMIPSEVISEHRYTWRAANGILYAFRYVEDANQFFEENVNVG